MSAPQRSAASATAAVPRWMSCGALLLVGLVLAACGAPAPVTQDRPQSARIVDPTLAALPEGHRVRAGDTLYSIAFRYGLDWRTVASWNGIGAPYTIRVEQWLQLRPPPGWSAAARPSRGSSGAATPAAPRPPPVVARTEPAPAPAGSATRPPQPQPQIVAPAPSPEPPRPAPAAAPSRPPEAAPMGPIANAASRAVAGVAWRWPTDGSVVRTFNSNDARKGILIGGRAGQAVVATADGEVVYSGNGLIGYGELIIIKHSERMLSAYAHNQERLAAEGDRVRAGQAIARMGRNEDNRDVLHFEIRRDGKPEDPAGYLPPRG